MFTTALAFPKKITVVVKFILGCDVHFESKGIGVALQNGTFLAPTFLNPDMHVWQCTYSFTAKSNERVMIEFEEFDLNGTPPE